MRGSPERNWFRASHTLKPSLNIFEHVLHRNSQFDSALISTVIIYNICLCPTIIEPTKLYDKK